MSVHDNLLYMHMHSLIHFLFFIFAPYNPPSIYCIANKINYKQKDIQREIRNTNIFKWLDFIDSFFLR
jgi:hypothetical protein